MKKTGVLLVSLIVLASWVTAAFATPSASDWSLGLNFTAGASSKDVLPVIVGTKTAGEELLKPPPLPGSTLTGDPADGFVNAYIMTSSSRQAAKSIATSNQKIWAIDVAVEEAGQPVTVTLDDSLFYPAYYTKGIKIIVPGEASPVKTFTAVGSKTAQLFTSDGVAKTVYLVIDADNAVYSPRNTGKVAGFIKTPGQGYVAGTNVKVYSIGTSSCGPQQGSPAVTDANGGFDIGSLSAGKYYVELTRPDFLGGRCSINVSETGDNQVECGSVFPGNFDSAAGPSQYAIDMDDLSSLKPVFRKKKSTDPAYWTANNLDRFDLYPDDMIDMSDLSEMKPGFRKNDSSCDCKKQCNWE